MYCYAFPGLVSEDLSQTPSQSVIPQDVELKEYVALCALKSGFYAVEGGVTVHQQFPRISPKCPLLFQKILMNFLNFN